MILTNSYYQSLLIEGKAKKLLQLAELAKKDRTPGEAKRYGAEAQAILRDLAELDDKLSLADGPAGLDYRDDAEINMPIVKYLTQVNRPATENEIVEDLIRGQFRGYKDERLLAIRVGRCVRSYTLGKPSENKVKRGLVGLANWPDKMFH